MKRDELLRYLRANGCELLREGARHSWWQNTASGKRSSIPRHVEIPDLLAKKMGKTWVGPLAGAFKAIAELRF